MDARIKKLLVVRQDKLGDLATTTAALRSVKKALPDLRVAVWIPEALEPVLRHNPHVDEVGFTSYRPGFAECARHLKQLRKARFDAAVFVKSRAGTHIPLTWLAGVPKRVGSTRKSYGRLLTRNLALPWDEMREHEAELSYRVLEACLETPLERLPMEVFFSEQDQEEARRIAEGGDYFVVSPCTGGTGRAWSEEGYVQAIRQIAQQTGWRCLVVGTAAEAEVAGRVAENAGPAARSVAGQTSILSLTALLKGARLLLCGSTGTLHLAASQQTPAALIEPTPDSAQRIAKWAPWMSPHRAVGAGAVCQGCDPIHCHQSGSACVASIQASEVVQAALDLCQETSFAGVDEERGATKA